MKGHILTMSIQIFDGNEPEPAPQQESKLWVVGSSIKFETIGTKLRSVIQVPVQFA